MKTKNNIKSESFLKSSMQKFVRHKLAMISLVILVIEVIAFVFLPIVTNIDPYTTHSGCFDKAPCHDFLLGTDEVGRDIFARVIYGGRVSLAVGFFSTVISALIGIPLGLVAGYYSGIVRMVIMRIIDMFMSFPAMIIQLVMVMVLGASATSVMLVLGLLGWTSFARMTYSMVLTIKEQEFVEAAKANGATDLRQIVQYILPNTLSPLFVRFSFNFASAILAESGLSFLGLGVQPPTATWGNMIYAAQTLSTLVYRPWQWLPPGVLLVLTVFCINFVGDGLRDALDPKMKI